VERKVMTQRESRLSRDILSALRQEGAFCFKVHGSEYMMAGLPDIIGVYRGRFFAFETKTPDKRSNTSPIQDRVLEKIRLAGGHAQVVCTIREAVEALDEIARQRFRKC
jgi:Holliday junction resolvase